MINTLLAQITNPALNETLGGSGTKAINQAESGATSVAYFVSIWRALIAVGGLTVIVYFIWSAFQWIYAGGDSGKIQKARDRITQSIIGMIILASSFVILNYISFIFFDQGRSDGFNLLRFEIPQAPGTENIPDDLRSRGRESQPEQNQPNNPNIPPQEETNDTI